MCRARTLQKLIKTESKKGSLFLQISLGKDTVLCSEGDGKYKNDQNMDYALGQV